MFFIHYSFVYFRQTNKQKQKQKQTDKQTNRQTERNTRNSEHAKLKLFT